MKNIFIFLFTFFLFLQFSIAKIITYTWKYKNQTVTMNLSLSTTTMSHYQNNQTSQGVYQKLEDFYEQKITPFKGDNTMRMVVAQLLTQAGLRRIKGSDNQLNFIMSFIQGAIGIDYNKEKNIMAEENAVIKTPYETLYSKKGVCIEKSLLAIAILREAGSWGTCLFVYPNAFNNIGHAAVGIQCPLKYSLYNSGYCYAETMLNLPVGVMPKINNSGQLIKGSYKIATGCPNNFGRVKTLLIMDGYTEYHLH